MRRRTKQYYLSKEYKFWDSTESQQSSEERIQSRIHKFEEIIETSDELTSRRVPTIELKRSENSGRWNPIERSGQGRSRSDGSRQVLELRGGRERGLKDIISGILTFQMCLFLRSFARGASSAGCDQWLPHTWNQIVMWMRLSYDLYLVLHRIKLKLSDK